MGGALVSGKYEITLAPWTWSGYADANTTATAHSQVVACTCASNSIAFSEQHLARIGGPPPDVFSQELPFKTCSAGTSDICYASAKHPLLSKDTAVEWSGLWSLSPGLYRWTLYASGKKEPSASVKYEYPDPAIDIYITQCTSLDEVSSAADAALKNAASISIEHQGTLDLKANQKHTIRLEEGASHTFVDLQVEVAGSYCMFTQHLPGEFGASYLSCINPGSGTEATCSYVFTEASRVYNNGGSTTPAMTSSSNTWARLSILLVGLAYAVLCDMLTS